MTYEYKVIMYQRWGEGEQGRAWGEEGGRRWPPGTQMAAILNELGAEGWCVTSNYGDEGGRLITMSRPKDEVLTQG
jgi:hypothetical protein